MSAPYDSPERLREYTWSAGEFSIKVRRMFRDRSIGPDIQECLAAGMSTEDYDKVIRWWVQL